METGKRPFVRRIFRGGWLGSFFFFFLGGENTSFLVVVIGGKCNVDRY